MPFRNDYEGPFQNPRELDSYNLYMVKSAVARAAAAAAASGGFPGSARLMTQTADKRSFLNGKKRSVDIRNAEDFYSEYEPIKSWAEKRSFLNG